MNRQDFPIEAAVRPFPIPFPATIKPPRSTTLDDLPSKATEEDFREWLRPYVNRGYALACGDNIFHDEKRQWFQSALLYKGKEYFEIYSSWSNPEKISKPRARTHYKWIFDGFRFTPWALVFPRTEPDFKECERCHLDENGNEIEDKAAP